MTASQEFREPRCKVCTHERVLEIEALMVANQGYRSAAQFGISETAFYRHQKQHLHKRRASKELAKQDTPSEIVKRLLAIHRITIDIIKEARQADDSKLALLAIARAEKQIELHAKIIGELPQEQTQQVTESPEWIALRSELIRALAPHPEAKQAVIKKVVLFSNLREEMNSRLSQVIDAEYETKP